ncbi:hypothetical protein ACFLZ9_01015 [Patescibacteria group bacterium]
MEAIKKLFSKFKRKPQAEILDVKFVDPLGPVSEEKMKKIQKFTNNVVSGRGSKKDINEIDF